jgi:hypothetical protein
VGPGEEGGRGPVGWGLEKRGAGLAGWKRGAGPAGADTTGEALGADKVVGGEVWEPSDKNMKSQASGICDRHTLNQ